MKKIVAVSDLLVAGRRWQRPRADEQSAAADPQPAPAADAGRRRPTPRRSPTTASASSPAASARTGSRTSPRSTASSSPTSSRSCSPRSSTRSSSWRPTRSATSTSPILAPPRRGPGHDQPRLPRPVLRPPRDGEGEFKNVSSDRGRIYLIHGEPNERIKIDCRLLQPIEIWKYAFIPGMGHDVRFLFYKARNGVDFKLFIADRSRRHQGADLAGRDRNGRDRRRRAVQRVFGPASPTTSTSRTSRCSCKYGDEFLRAIYQAQLNKFDLARVFEPPQVNEEDVHKILRSVVLATPNAPKLDARGQRAVPGQAGQPHRRRDHDPRCRARSSR